MYLYINVQRTEHMIMKLPDFLSSASAVYVLHWPSIGIISLYQSMPQDNKETTDWQKCTIMQWKSLKVCWHAFTSGYQLFTLRLLFLEVSEQSKPKINSFTLSDYFLKVWGITVIHCSMPGAPVETCVTCPENMCHGTFWTTQFLMSGIKENQFFKNTF